MSDEEVIKRRLQIDGDGTGDDRRLNDLLKTFIKWCNSNDAPENSQTVYDRLLAQLAQCEFDMKKSDFYANVMQQELKNYAAISEAIEQNIETAKAQIVQSKQNLVLAKKIRKNRMEYDVLAKIINQQPDRKKTMQELESLKQEMDQLKESKADLERKLGSKKKDFTVLMRSIVELQNKLDPSMSVTNSASCDEEVTDVGENAMDEKMICDEPMLQEEEDDGASSDNDEVILSSPEKLT
ncbi:THO complex subunit 7 homolog [Anopheles ziemanni]|uniref:THO complex subunit 7 homolog n=1 Tax=Anopheles coustani TaxID=139045 RepID=UPI00265B0AD7|nr:THO complex subunit 7 homolog [Anopheles coustani]XP_058174703.1 THO complex subunit 7 homolog [Anopheles ziemanni]